MELLSATLEQSFKVTSLGAESVRLCSRTLVRTDAAGTLKEAGLPAHYSPHSVRVTGITNFLEKDGTLEAAQRISGHADSRPRKFMTAAAREFCSRIWKLSDIALREMV
jgi:hypothetical protein